MKKFITFLLISVCAIGLMTGCKTSKEEKGETSNNSEPTANTEENVIKDQTVGELSFVNTSLIYEDGMSTFETTVTNTTSEPVNVSEITIHLKDAEGQEVVALTGFIGGQLNANESRIITSSATQDLTTVSTLEYEIIR